MPNEILQPDVVEAMALGAIPAHAARLNVTWSGSNGDLTDPVPYDASDDDLKQMANGDIPGIAADETVNLNDFIVDRFPATDEIDHARVFIRPKTPFGSIATSPF